MRWLGVICCLAAVPLADGAAVVDRRALGDGEVKVLSAGSMRAVSPATRRVRLEPGDLAVARKQDPPEKIEMADKVQWRLPVEIWTANPTEPEQVLRLEALVEIVEGGLRQIEDGVFSGNILVGLRDQNDPGRKHNLDPSIHIQITGDAAADPAQITLAHTSLPFTPVRLNARAPGGAVKVKVTPDFDPSGFELAIPVRPSLVLRSAPQRIQGWGLETTDVSVRLVGGPPGDPVTVSLSSNASKVEPASVQVSVGQPAQVQVRSRGLGEATVTAEGAGMVAATEIVSFVFPWSFLIAAVIGGLVGGLIKVMRGAQAKAQEAWRPVLLGVLTGVLVAVAYAVGINLIEFEPVARVGEAAVFVLAAIGALQSKI